jgi:hypothetical protein
VVGMELSASNEHVDLGFAQFDHEADDRRPRCRARHRPLGLRGCPRGSRR